MKWVISAAEMARIEKLAISDGASEEAFVKEAGFKVAGVASEIAEKNLPILLLVGKGNKGADAWTAGSFLLERGFSVHALAAFPPKTCSSLNQKMRAHFEKNKGQIVEADVDFSLYGLLIDGLLGTGFQGTLEPFLAELIQKANASTLPILAIDIPSGLNGTTGEGAQSAIQASATIALGSAKTGCFLKNGWNCVGELFVEDFGLESKYFEKTQPFAELVEFSDLRWPTLIRNRHKYEAGYVIGYGGSKQFSGAPKLASLAAIRSGAGIVRLFYPKEAESRMESCFPELIHGVWEESSWDCEIKRASALFVGPGLGSRPDLENWMEKHLAKIEIPCVLDAESLMTNPKHWPKKVVLTPHRGEASRLLHVEKPLSDEELLARCQDFSDKTGAVIVLKGAPTFVLAPKKIPAIIAHGDPGMATAGAGDVLTGIIASFLAQKLSCRDAALLGVALHAVAGEKAADAKTSYGMIASDLIDYLFNWSLD